MKPYYEDDLVTVYHGDCLRVLAALPEGSISAAVTDPPYELAFMGRSWDQRRVAFDPDTRRQVFRVLKPGAHLVAFGGTRTYHRMTCAIEDAGFEVRDCLAWLYGSGFPKSLDVSKAIDKTAPRLGMFEDFAKHYGERRRSSGMTHAAVCAATGAHGKVNHGGASTNWEAGYNVPTRSQWAQLQPLLGLSDEWLPLIERIEAEREKIGETAGVARPGFAGDRYGDNGGESVVVDITAPATPEAVQWAGWGTALKPAFEPVVLARKPLIGTVAENVLEHGTGALDIDRSRVGERWPANVVLDELAATQLDEHTGTLTSGSRESGQYGVAGGRGIYGEYGSGEIPAVTGDFGGASRFFYCAKADTQDRGAGNDHPTVKPVDLMRWLIRLVTPAGGVVLDPFSGSGSTLEAAIAEGRKSIGVEQDEHYCDLIAQRLKRPIEVSMFSV